MANWGQPPGHHSAYGAPPPTGYQQQGYRYSAPPTHGGVAHGHCGAPQQQGYGGAPQGYGYGVPRQQYQVPAGAGGYGGYGGHPAAQPGPPPGIDPTLWSWFQAVDVDHSGGISADELRQALVNGNWSHFNAETCRLMIGMFDKDKSGTIDIHEFSALWKYIQEWKQCFDGFDRDRSGTIDAGELHQAFATFGYRLSMDFCQLCVRQFDRAHAHTMKLDDFIQCCVMLKSLTEAFRHRDAQQRGVITISYEQFMEMALDNTLSV